MTIAIGTPHLAVIAGTTYKQLFDDFRAYSDTLRTWIMIDAGFVYDEESTPWKGENPIAGLIHDYLSRFDSFPVVTKEVAARVYFEFQKYEDSFINKKKSWFSRAWDCVWRYFKAGTVAVVPDCVYWHKFSVSATYEEITA
jgi:hypothetical protein